MFLTKSWNLFVDWNTEQQEVLVLNTGAYRSKHGELHFKLKQSKRLGKAQRTRVTNQIPVVLNQLPDADHN